MFRTVVVLASILVALCRPAAAEEPLVMLVMDPLAAPLACPCVEGHAQRKYDKLAEFLTKRLDRPVKAVFSYDLGKALRGAAHGHVDLIVGKQSVVIFDAQESRLTVRPLAMLTGKDGTDLVAGGLITLNAIVWKIEGAPVAYSRNPVAVKLSVIEISEMLGAVAEHSA